jgi:hypothetical protein
VKGHHQIVFIDDRGGKLAGDDLLEQRLAHSDCPPAYSTTKANSSGADSALKHWRR